jgi:hypothetical protein
MTSSVARITQVTYSSCYHHSSSHDNGDFTNISINQSNDVDVSATNKGVSSKATVTQSSTIDMGRSSTDD